MARRYIQCSSVNFYNGDIVDGRYRIEQKLGEGTYGQVFKVDCYGQKSALKLLKLWMVDESDRERLVNRFDMEFHTGQISSNYLVHSSSQGQVSGNPYIIMEFCGEGSLRDKMENGAYYDVAKVCLEVLYGLKDLHTQGKNHRDLKPDNVLFKNGVAALTDFGISGDKNNRQTGWGRQVLFGKECPDQIFGTYAYIPPEQLNPPAKEVTILPVNDIFSFGIMAYEMLTGQYPYGPMRNDSDWVNYMQRCEKYRWDSQTLERRAPEWTSLIARCIHPDFKQRIQTVDEVIAAIPRTTRVAKGTIYDSIGGKDKSYLNIVNGIQLRITQGEEYGRIYRLGDIVASGRRIITIGRKDFGVTNAVEIIEEDTCFISRRHCTIEADIEQGLWILRDGQWRMAERCWMNSTNGTFVNSTEVDSGGFILSPGDIITIGDTKLRVEGY